MSILNDIDLLKCKLAKKEENSAVFEFEPIAPGYGITIAHSLRRILLSSLQGSAITSVKIDGASHEFSTIKGVKEDVVEIILNLKHLTVNSFSNEPITLKLDKKGPGVVTAGDFAKNADVEILDPTHPIATLDKNAKLSMEVVVEKGYGYMPVEKREGEKLPLGTIAMDAIFNPVKKINYQVQDTRVGGNTNYNKLSLEITTNGCITPEAALKNSIEILTAYLNKILPEIPAENTAKKATKTAKAKTEKTAKVKKTTKKSAK